MASDPWPQTNGLRLIALQAATQLTIALTQESPQPLDWGLLGPGGTARRGP